MSVLSLHPDLGLLSLFVRSQIRFSFTWVILFVHLLCNDFRSPDQCWVLGYRKSCCPYPSCKRWWYSPLWPGCFWKCILLSWTETSLVSPHFTYYCSCLGQLKPNPKPCTDGVICVGLCDQWQNACCHMLAHMADERQSLSRYMSVLLLWLLNLSNFLDFELDVSWRPYVCPHQNLAPLAPQDQHNPEALCHLLCCGCLCHPCPCDVQG